eukprot:8493356-Lingulodinium_polyedra.AAC.1
MADSAAGLIRAFRSGNSDILARTDERLYGATQFFYATSAFLEGCQPALGLQAAAPRVGCGAGPVEGDGAA